MEVVEAVATTTELAVMPFETSLEVDSSDY